MLWGCRKMERLCIVSGNEKLHSHYGSNVAIPQKLNIGLSFNLEIPLHRGLEHNGCSLVKSTNCTSRGPRFYSQHPHAGSQPSVIWALGDLMPSSGLWALSIYVVYKYTCRKNTCKHKIIIFKISNVYTNVHSSFIHGSLKVERIRISSNWEMNKQNVVYPCSEYTIFGIYSPV